MNKKMNITTALLASLLLLGGCGSSDTNSGDDREYSLKATSQLDEATAKMKSFRIDFNTTKKDTISILQLAPSTLGLEAPILDTTTLLALEGNTSLDDYCDNAGFDTATCLDFKDLIKDYNTTYVLSRDNIVPTNQTIQCTRTTELNSSSEDVNYSCSNTTVILSDSSSATSEQNITLKSDRYNLLYRSIRLKTIYSDYYITENKLEEN